MYTVYPLLHAAGVSGLTLKMEKQCKKSIRKFYFFQRRTWEIYAVFFFGGKRSVVIDLVTTKIFQSICMIIRAILTTKIINEM